MTWRWNDPERRLALTPWAVALTVALAYAPFVPGEFVWDDRILVEGNAALRDVGGLRAVFTRDLFGGAGASAGQVYRPLAVLTIWAQAQVHGVAVAPLRAGNLAMLAGAAAALWWWLRRRDVSAGVSALAALAWALHPLGVAPTLWISGRHDLLASLWVFVALGVWPRADERAAPRAVAAALCAFAGMLSKETAVVIPALLALDALRRALTRERDPHRAWLPVPLAGVFAALALRAALGISSSADMLRAGPWALARAFGGVLVAYAPRMALGRSGPTIECWRSAPAAACVAALAAWSLSALATAYLARRRADASLAWTSLGLAFAGVALAPAALAIP